MPDVAVRQMIKPAQYGLEISFFLILLAGGLFFLRDALGAVFMANPIINGSILTVLFIGLILVYKTIFDLITAQNWSDEFRRNEEKNEETAGYLASKRTPRLIRPTANLLLQRIEQQGFLQFNSQSMRAILDGLSVRLEEARETLRYVVGLLVFLGLLGTFWGLMQTIQAVGGVIDSLPAGDAELANRFSNLKEGLKTPISGMGTAFSSSLFGLAGSLLLGYCALRVGQAQNRFYQDYEEWLSSMTRLSGALSGDGDTSGMGLALTLLEQSADSIEKLQAVIARSESKQAQLYGHIGELNDRLSGLVDSIKVEQDLMRKLAEGQISTRQLLERIYDREDPGDSLPDALKTVNRYLATLSSEMVTGREQSVKTIKDELRLISRTISNTIGVRAAKGTRAGQLQAEPPQNEAPDTAIPPPSLAAPAVNLRQPPPLKAPLKASGIKISSTNPNSEESD